MFKIIQSHRTENLVEQLLVEYQSKEQPIFEPFIVIVPSMVLGDWLDKTIASRAGISTLVKTKFWGQYQWTLMQEVLNKHNDYLLDKDPNAKTLSVPEVAVLSPTVMQWRIFGFLTNYHQAIIANDKHPLYPLLISLVESIQDQKNGSIDPAQKDARLWQLASDLARVFNRYLTHREDWLDLWSNNKQLPVEQLIEEKDTLSLRFDKYARGTPDWLVNHYVELEAAQRFLWQALFADVHLHRVALEKVFWNALERNEAHERDQLPKVLRIFTIQQLPQTELDFLQNLSKYMDITLLHYNPSKLFWADIVDKSWLQRQQIINPESVFLRDYGHSLLSRLGKQSRDTFAMLANLSGNDDYLDDRVEWYDNFEDDFSEQSFIEHGFNDDGLIDDSLIYDEVNDDLSNGSPVNDEASLVESNESQSVANYRSQQPSLLRKLQNDVLMLDEQSTQEAAAAKVSKDLGEQIELGLEPDPYADEVLANKYYDKQRLWEISSRDNSLSIHSCHSLQRQLEVLRIMIGRWLNEPLPKGAKPRHVSDIVVLLPDVERHHALISSIFVSGKGQDGLTLPAKVTGVVDVEIRQLWEAVIGFYKLLGSESARFEAAEVLDWLMLPPLYENFGLTHEQMSRGCDLLIEAGFIRGFDEAHLKQTLDNNDYDYRFTFAQALDRLALGLVMPEAGLTDCLYPLQQGDWPDSALPEKSLPLSQVSLNDAPIIEALCQIYTGLVERRYDHQQSFSAEVWLKQIETQVIHRYFAYVDQSRSMRAIYNAMNGFKSSLRANRHYSQYTEDEQARREMNKALHKVEELPLKLSFMLDSIEAELESQQVSAEPTGVITFGRFGALRNVPFELVVMLNMNLSEFPGQDRDNRYDLMKATIARRGDRVSEDDDNGAFLDALLCARSACWIFYNGQSLTDTNEHLPANPVSELLQFLQGEVQWQVKSLENMPQDINPDAESVKRQLPNLIKQWLVTEHPALPFDKRLFEIETSVGAAQVVTDHTETSDSLPTDDSSRQLNDEQDLLEAQLNKAMRKTKLAQQRQFPPAPLWQAVFDTLNTHSAIDETLPRVALPTREQYKTIATILAPQSKDKLADEETVLSPETPLEHPTDNTKDEPVENELGKLGRIDDKGIQSLITMLNLEYKDNAEAKTALKQAIFDIEEIDVDGALTYQVRHPAKAFLRAQQVHIVQGQASIASQEPLFLDSLSTYQINDHLINKLAMDNKADAHELDARDDEQHLIYQKIMPAGVARQTTLSNQQQKLLQKCEEFKEQLIKNESDAQPLMDHIQSIDHPFLLTPTKEEPVRLDIKQLFLGVEGDNFESDNKDNWLALLPKSIKMKGKVPVMMGGSNDSTVNNDSDASAKPYAEQSPRYWLNILSSSASPQYLLKFWLSHLYWQVARRTTAQQVALQDGVSLWRYNKPRDQVSSYKGVVAFKLEPIEYKQAAIELIKWAVFGNLAGQVPITLLPDYALEYVSKALKAQQEEKSYWPSRSEYASWFVPNFHTDMVFDNCVLHPIWQYVLRDDDKYKALTTGLINLAKPLYEPMYESLIKLQ